MIKQCSFFKRLSKICKVEMLKKKKKGKLKNEQKPRYT